MKRVISYCLVVCAVFVFLIMAWSPLIYSSIKSMHIVVVNIPLLCNKWTLYDVWMCEFFLARGSCTLSLPCQPRQVCEVLRWACLSVCLSVCLLPVSHIWKTACPYLTQFSVRVICGHGSVLWRQCNLCNLLRTSGFVGVCAYRLICHPSWRQKHPFAACAVEALPIVCLHHSARGGRVHSPPRGVTGRSLLSRLSSLQVL